MGIEAALVADVEAEEQAAQQYRQIVGEIEGTRKNVTAARNEAESNKKQKEAALAAQEKKQAKIEQCAQWRARYESDKVTRAGEIDVIAQVEEIVATRLDTMADYLQDAANAE